MYIIKRRNIFLYLPMYLMFLILFILSLRSEFQSVIISLQIEGQTSFSKWNFLALNYLKAKI